MQKCSEEGPKSQITRLQEVFSFLFSLSNGIPIERFSLLHDTSSRSSPSKYTHFSFFRLIKSFSNSNSSHVASSSLFTFTFTVSLCIFFLLQVINRQMSESKPWKKLLFAHQNDGGVMRKHKINLVHIF